MAHPCLIEVMDAEKAQLVCCTQSIVHVDSQSQMCDQPVFMWDKSKQSRMVHIAFALTGYAIVLLKTWPANVTAAGL